MKKLIEIEQTFCDFCGRDDCHDKCLGCGKDICYTCKKIEAKEYRHAVYCSGSGDGTYCHGCDLEKRKSGDKLHAAYRMIESLRNEMEGFSVNFKHRSDKAEAEIKALLHSR